VSTLDSVIFHQAGFSPRLVRAPSPEAGNFHLNPHISANFSRNLQAMALGKKDEQLPVLG